jgi:hypothetical protein
MACVEVCALSFSPPFSLIAQVFRLHDWSYAKRRAADGHVFFDLTEEKETEVLPPPPIKPFFAEPEEIDVEADDVIDIDLGTAAPAIEPLDDEAWARHVAAVNAQFDLEIDYSGVVSGPVYSASDSDAEAEDSEDAMDLDA